MEEAINGMPILSNAHRESLSSKNPENEEILAKESQTTQKRMWSV